MVPRFSSEMLGWMALLGALGFLLMAQLDAGLALRGLYADGAFYVVRLLSQGGFAILEPSRWTAQVIMQAPVVLAMALGLDGARQVGLLFSLTTNLTPLLLTMASLWALPRPERRFFLFPVFVFLGGSMGSAFASVADGATAAAYAWLLFLLLLFGPLTRLRLAVILLLSLGSLRLHEEMAFLGPILAVTALLRPSQSAPMALRSGLILATSLLALSSVIEWHYVLTPHSVGNRDSFVSDLVGLRWFLASGQGLNLTAMLGLTGLSALALALWTRTRWVVILGFTLLAGGLTITALLGALPAAPAAAFAARNNGALLSLPTMVLCLLLSRRPGFWPRRLAAPLALGAALATCLALIDLRASADWRGYVSRFETTLHTGQGVLPWKMVAATLPPKPAEAFARFSWPWTSPLLSLLLAPDQDIHAIIASRSPDGWQPFDASDRLCWHQMVVRHRCPAQSTDTADTPLEAKAYPCCT
jgi:hypothetical protein